MFFHVLLGIITIIICIFLFIRVYFHFWSRQPMFHSWDLFYYIKTPGIIESKLPKINKFCNLHNTHMMNYTTIQNIDFQRLVYFIQRHINKHYTQINISNLLNDHRKDPFCFFYINTKLLFNKEKDYNITDFNIKGTLIFRPIYITLEQKHLSPYFIDFLCIDKNIPVKERNNIKEELLQTSIYKHSQETKKHNLYLIKNEKKIPGLLPWIKYKVFSYYWKSYIRTYQSNISMGIYDLDQIDQYNLDQILSILKFQKNNFICTLSTNLSNLYNLLKSNLITIYALKEKHTNNYCSIYIYRSNYSIHNTININLCSSISLDNNIAVFINGFILSSQKIIKKFKIDFLSIDNISYNNIIITDIHKYIKPYKITKLYLYLYNYGTKILNNKDILAIY